MLAAGQQVNTDRLKFQTKHVADVAAFSFRTTRSASPAGTPIQGSFSSSCRRTLRSSEQRACRIGAPRAPALDDTRARRPAACRRPQSRAKASASRRPGRTSLDRPERGRTNPSPPRRPSGHARPVRGRRAADARRHTIRLLDIGVLPEAPMVVLNPQPAPRRAGRDDPIAFPSTWVVARIAGRTQ